MSNKNEDIYAQALEEFESDNRNQGLYAKCFAEADGDENKAKARYIKSRADELTGSVTPEAPRSEEVSHNSERSKIVGIENQKESFKDFRVSYQAKAVLWFLCGFFGVFFIWKSTQETYRGLDNPTFYVGDSPDWLYGRWEEDPISGINLTRWMEFRKDGTVERGQLEKTTTYIQSYEVEGDLVIVDNYISDTFNFKTYYKKIDDGVLARANSSGTVESSEKYYKK